jgi:hypothetical protein
VGESRARQPEPQAHLGVDGRWATASVGDPSSMVVSPEAGRARPVGEVGGQGRSVCWLGLARVGGWRLVVGGWCMSPAEWTRAVAVLLSDESVYCYNYPTICCLQLAQVAIWGAVTVGQSWSTTWQRD